MESASLSRTNSSAVLTCGNGSSGIGISRAAHIGAQPSSGRHSRSRSDGTPSRTLSLNDSKAAFAAASSVTLVVKRFSHNVSIISLTGPAGRERTYGQAVRIQLCHQASVSRTDSKINDSGKASINSGQNAAGGKSIAAPYPCNSSLQFGSLPLAAAVHTGA